MKGLETHGEKTNLLKNALVYLDKSRNLKYIKEACLSYANSSSDVVLYKFVLKLYPSDILDICVDLGNLVLSNPSGAGSLFQEVVYYIIKTLKLIPCEIRRSQVYLVLRLQSLPAIKLQYYIETVRDLKAFQSNGRFLGFDGVVTGLSATSSYTQSTLYFCPVEGCNGRSGKQYVRVHVPGASELQTIRNDFVCFHCGTVLEEDKSKRVIGDKLIAELIPLHVLNTDRRIAGRTQAIPVYLRDEFVDIPVIGELYNIIGLVRHDFDAHCDLLAIEANNINKVEWIASSERLDVCKLPSTIRFLYEDHINSPWSFVRCLACHFGDTVTPQGSFFKLKLGLLLSLVLTASESKVNSPLLHILACGKESLLLDRLFSYSCRFAERAVMHSSSNALTGRITKDRYQKSQFFIEGGSLPLASGGVCSIGDLGRYKKVTKETIQSTLDARQVVIDVKSKFSHGLPQQHCCPLSCHVWAYNDPSRQRSCSDQDELIGTADTGEIQKPLLDVFSLVFFTDLGDSSDSLQEEIAQEAITTALGKTKEPAIGVKDFKEFLRFARQRDVTLTASAEVILQSYYQACRRMRTCGLSGSSIPISTLSTLYTLSFAHAKLSLRQEVTESDAVMAAYLCEESLTARYGISVLNVRPTAHYTLEDFNMAEMDRDMYCFQSMLRRFCGDANIRPGLEE